MIIYVDIDNTICHSLKNDKGEWDYELSKPRYEQIKKSINYIKKAILLFIGQPGVVPQVLIGIV